MLFTKPLRISKPVGRLGFIFGSVSILYIWSYAELGFKLKMEMQNDGRKERVELIQISGQYSVTSEVNFTKNGNIDKQPSKRSINS